MRYATTRKYPITHMKKSPDETNERVFDLSIPVAAGLLALIFVKGIFWGYMLKKWMD
jgi:hypothetical protein